MIMEALKFMVMGMGIVFAFLVIMVFALKAQAAIIGKYFPEEVKANTGGGSSKPQGTANNTAQKIAAITAAVQHHNNQKG